MDIVSQQKSDDQRDATLERIQRTIVWYDTEKVLPDVSDGDMNGWIWVFVRTTRMGLPIDIDTVLKDPRRYPFWTHTPNIPLRISKIYGGKL